jgi:hypothetical protein
MVLVKSWLATNNSVGSLSKKVGHLIRSFRCHLSDTLLHLLVNNFLLLYWVQLNIFSVGLQNCNSSRITNLQIDTLSYHTSCAITCQHTNMTRNAALGTLRGSIKANKKLSHSIRRWWDSIVIIMWRNRCFR